MAVSLGHEVALANAKLAATKQQREGEPGLNVRMGGGSQTFGPGRGPGGLNLVERHAKGRGGTE